MLINYHDEWGKILTSIESKCTYEKQMQIVIPILSKNQHFNRIVNGKGIGEIFPFMNNFEEFMKLPSSDKFFIGELLYTLWLLGMRLEKQFSDTLQKRIDEFFKGNYKYENCQTAGFRQFEYELQVICRLIENQVNFEDIKEEGKPDLLVEKNIYVEIKMPTSNYLTSLEKAIKQIGDGEGIVIMSLDNILSSEIETEQKTIKAQEIIEKIQNILKEKIAVIIEFYPKIEINKDNRSLCKYIGDERLCDIARKLYSDGY